jgi:hypothetical protein
MAVDTRDKRASMIGLRSATPRLLPNPSGTIGAPARLHLLFLYSGIAAVVPTIPMAFRFTLIVEALPA